MNEESNLLLKINHIYESKLHALYSNSLRIPSLFVDFRGQKSYDAFYIVENNSAFSSCA